MKHVLSFATGLVIGGVVYHVASDEKVKEKVKVFSHDVKKDLVLLKEKLPKKVKEVCEYGVCCKCCKHCKHCKHKHCCEKCS